MGSAYDLTVASVITIMMFIMHRISVEMFAPGTALYTVATDGTANVNGAQHADLWFQIIGIWAPFGASVAILIWSLIREYKRQVSTVAQRAP